jgi:uncharacterized membrane protein YidH (DUF202 family)
MDMKEFFDWKGIAITVCLLGAIAAAIAAIIFWRKAEDDTSHEKDESNTRKIISSSVAGVLVLACVVLGVMKYMDVRKANADRVQEYLATVKHT